MKKNSLLLMFFALISSASLFSNTSINNLVYIHLGLIIDTDVEINTWWYYKGMGIINAYNINIFTRTLSHSGSMNGSNIDIKCSKYSGSGSLAGLTRCST